MASQQTRLEYDLVDTQERLSYYKNKLSGDPNPLVNKWVEIYADRLNTIKNKLETAPVEEKQDQ